MAMKDFPSLRRFPLFAVLSVLLVALAAPTSTTLAQNGVTNLGVLKRMTTMASARTAVETLANMMAGRIRFDRKLARSARRGLITATRAIPSEFRQPHTDPLSRARMDIWIHWDDFKTRAATAKRMAKDLNVDRLGALRSTLPDMINACLSCHRTYRKPR
jgi:cytochrome c556